MQSANRRQQDLLVRRLTYSAVCLALAMVLPFITGQIPQIGVMLSPMHIPAFLCGFLCGWPWGLAVGFIAPLLRSTLGMPVFPATAVPMAFELAVYGAVAGLLYRLLRRKPWGTLAALAIAMILGRIVHTPVKLAVMSWPPSMFFPTLIGLFTGSWPGIILHAVIIPPIVIALERAKMTT